MTLVWIYMTLICAMITWMWLVIAHLRERIVKLEIKLAGLGPTPVQKQTITRHEAPK